jgi:hypothetical protein
MDVPCIRAIGSESAPPLPLRVDSAVDSAASPARTLYCTDVEGTELRVALQAPAAESSLETDRWYRFSGLRRAAPGRAELALPADGGSVDPTDAPAARTHRPLADSDDPWVIQLGASEQFVVVTVQPRPATAGVAPSADAPESFEIGAVCIGYPDADESTAVYHREEPGPRDEQLLLEHVAEDLSGLESATLVTDGRDHSPFEMLQARLAVAAGGDIVDASAERALEGLFGVNVASAAVRAGAGTLQAFADEVGVETDPVQLDGYDIRGAPADWRADIQTEGLPVSSLSDPRMIQRDYATLLERYLDDDQEASTTELGACLKAYASATVSTLGELVGHDATSALACRRLDRDSLE